MPKLEKIKAGDKLWDYRNRNTYWPVEIVSVDLQKRTAIIIWNFNATRPTTVNEAYIEKLRIKEP